MGVKDVCINPNKSSTIDEDIRKGIEESKVIITILENSKPNVYFEYGYARSFRNKKRYVRKTI